MTVANITARTNAAAMQTITNAVVDMLCKYPRRARPILTRTALPSSSSAGVGGRARGDGCARSIYGAAPERPFVRRYLVSFALTIAVGGCFISATLCLALAPFFSVSHQSALWDVFVFLARWALAGAFLLLAVGLLLRHAPARHQPIPWVSLGAGIVIGAWAIVSVGFYFYLTSIASYKTVFGSLASVIVVMAYLYTSTIVFLFGAQLDAIIRAQATGTLSGARLESGEHP
jgi:uncharacterized BrkB/YihY/UPF0761 family membrane protein